MRHRFHTILIVCAAVALLVGGPAAGDAASRETETVYLDGHTAQINTQAAVVFDASSGLLNHTSPVFIIGFPVAPDATGPITLPSGYQPQHNGFPRSPIPYHDHVLASTLTAPRQIVEMRYSWAYASSPDFVPITGADQIPAAEAAGKLDIINPVAPDPQQLWTSIVLVCPVVAGR
jgi:hypothetical protein